MDVDELQKFALRLACNVNNEETWRAIFAEYMQRCRETEGDDADDKIAGFVLSSLRSAIATTRAHEREILLS